MTNNFKKAYTMAEFLIVIIMIGIFVSIYTFVAKPGAIREDALMKAGSNLYRQLDFAIKTMLAKRSKDYSMFSLIGVDDSLFSITDKQADAKLISLLKKNVGSIRTNSVSSQYLSRKLIDLNNNLLIIESNDPDEEEINLKISDFSNGIFLKNGTYLALKLNENCTTTEKYVYSPAKMDTRTQKNSCGLIFFDVNGENVPNTLGIDQYIISIGKTGLK